MNRLQYSALSRHAAVASALMARGLRLLAELFDANDANDANNELAPTVLHARELRSARPSGGREGPIVHEAHEVISNESADTLDPDRVADTTRSAPPAISSLPATLRSVDVGARGHGEESLL